MQSIYVRLYTTKAADSGENNGDVGRTQAVCHVTYVFFGSSLGEDNYQVLSL